MSRQDRHIPNVLDPYDPTSYLTQEERSAAANGLRKLADWVENSRFPLPRTIFYGDALKFFIHSSWIHDESFIKRPGAAARLIGGMVKKGVQFEWMETSDFQLTREFGGGVKLEYVITRDAVCTPREQPETVTIQQPVDQVKARQLREDIDALTHELDEMERVPVETVVTKTVFDCPPALLPEAEQESVATTSSDDAV